MYFVKVYDKGCSSEEQWAESKQLVSQEVIWEALLSKLKVLDNKYDFAFLEFETLTMGELIDAIRHFVTREGFYKELYGKNNSDKDYADLINIAKLIALYQGEINYHRFLLPDTIQAYDVSYDNKLYRMKHADLCAVRRTTTPQEFDLIPFNDLMENLKASGRLQNFYAAEPIQPDQTIAHRDCRHRQTYLDYTRTMSGKLSKPAYAALKEFSELVSSAFDASHNIEGFFYRQRVNAKYKALQNLCAFLESLPEGELVALHAVKISDSQTFKSRLDQVLRENCISQFADDITKLLYQCNNNIQFTNPRPNQIINTHRRSLVLRGEVLNTDADDLSFLRNLQKNIINTHFKVKIGTKITLSGKTNWVPGHVAEIFHRCDEGVTGRVVPGEARYNAVKTASESSRTPHHDSILLYLLLLLVNIRDKTTDNFYAMVFDRRCSKIIEENESLDHHPAFTVGLVN